MRPCIARLKTHGFARRHSAWPSILPLAWGSTKRDWSERPGRWELGEKPDLRALGSDSLHRESRSLDPLPDSATDPGGDLGLVASAPAQKVAPVVWL